MLGERIGGFEVVARIGRGGMGVVYRARQVSLDRQVALKTLAPGLELDEALIERFRAEARAASRTNHPNLVQVYDVGSEGDTHYLAMELVEGESLASLIRQQGSMDYLRAAAITSQVAAGLGALHAVGVVHRDVKPSNILVRPDLLVKVTDFGVALLEEGMRRITADGTTVGTADYMSPEQARGEELDGRSDIYSLGVVLYQMLSGQVPFGGATPLVVMQRHCEESPPSLRRVRSDVPDRLAEIVSKCLSKDRGERYQTSEALAADLDHVRLEMEFAALSAETPAGGTRLYSTRTVLALQREQAARRGLVRRVWGYLAGAATSLWRHAAGTLDRDVVALRRAAGRMETALAELGEAKQKRSELRKRAGELRERAERARVDSGAAFDRNEVARADELVEEEKRCDEAAIDLQAAADALEGTVAELEQRYKSASDEHARLRIKVDLREAEAIQGILGRTQRRRRMVRGWALALFLLILIGAAVVYVHSPPPVISRAVMRAREEAAIKARDEASAAPSTLPKAVIRGDLEAVRDFFTPGKKVDQIFEGRTALYIAAQHGHREIAEFLLRRGANVNEAMPVNQQTPLHVAAHGGHDEVVSFLLGAKANANVQDYLGVTPMHEAAAGGHASTIRLLFANGAIVDSVNKSGRSPLYLAVAGAHEEAVEALLANGATVDLREADRRTPLHTAASGRDIQVVQFLLKTGADPNAVDAAGRTPLHYAAVTGNSAIARLLIEAGGRADVPDRAGKTAEQRARELGRTGVVEILRSARQDEKDASS